MQQQRQRKLFCVSKEQLRQLIGRGKGVPMPTSTFSRWWRQYDLHEKIGMSESEFRRTHWFYMEQFERLKTVVGFDDSDILEL